MDYLLVYAYGRGASRIFTPSRGFALRTCARTTSLIISQRIPKLALSCRVLGDQKAPLGREGMGKRGGVRVIYYYHDEPMPLYLLTIFGKGEKDNLTNAEQNALRRLVRTLIEARRKRHG